MKKQMFNKKLVSVVMVAFGVGCSDGSFSVGAEDTGVAIQNDDAIITQNDDAVVTQNDDAVAEDTMVLRNEDAVVPQSETDHITNTDSGVVSVKTDTNVSISCNMANQKYMLVSNVLLIRPGAGIIECGDMKDGTFIPSLPSSNTEIVNTIKNNCTGMTLFNIYSTNFKSDPSLNFDSGGPTGKESACFQALKDAKFVELVNSKWVYHADQCVAKAQTEINPASLNCTKFVNDYQLNEVCPTDDATRNFNTVCNSTNLKKAFDKCRFSYNKNEDCTLSDSNHNAICTESETPALHFMQAVAYSFDVRINGLTTKCASDRAGFAKQ
jgi:hypothetical protein